jgi:hypothetical protein
MAIEALLFVCLTFPGGNRSRTFCVGSGRYCFRTLLESFTLPLYEQRSLEPLLFPGSDPEFSENGVRDLGLVLIVQCKLKSEPDNDRSEGENHCWHALGSKHVLRSHEGRS